MLEEPSPGAADSTLDSPVPASPPARPARDVSAANSVCVPRVQTPLNGLVRSHSRPDDVHTPSHANACDTSVKVRRQDVLERYRYARRVQALLGENETRGGNASQHLQSSLSAPLGEYAPVEDDIRSLVCDDGWPYTAYQKDRRSRPPGRIVRTDDRAAQTHWTQTDRRGPRLVTPSLPVAAPVSDGRSGIQPLAEAHQVDAEQEDDWLHMRPRGLSIDAPPPLPPPRRSLWFPPYGAHGTARSPATGPIARDVDTAHGASLEHGVRVADTMRAPWGRTLQSKGTGPCGVEVLRAVDPWPLPENASYAQFGEFRWAPARFM